MNWKNVLRLIKVDVKSGRLIRGQNLRKYTKNSVFPYIIYGGACLLGLVMGWLAGNFYSGIQDPETQAVFYQGALQLFLSLPTVVLLYSLVFSMMSQLQRSGINASIQPPYWLPITWMEHTLASIISSLLGFPSASLIFIGSAISVASVFLGEIGLAVVTIFALLGSALLASITAEIYRILQVRLIGGVYKSSGKAAVWIRFIGSILFLIAFYIVWFAITSGTGGIALIRMIAEGQGTVWFLPFVWLSLTVASLVEGLLLNVAVFSSASVLFIFALFYLAVGLNRKFGLYEPPAIKVSRGAYSPKRGFLSNLGFSSLQAAIIKKDFKAFTRRRELFYLLIIPIVFIIMPLMQNLGTTGIPQSASFLLGWMFIVPGTIMAVMMGSMIIGQEGQSVWLLFSSPITARSLVKSKFTFVTLLSCTITFIVSGIIGVLFTLPPLGITLALLIESILLISALTSVSIGAGIRGADFTEVPRPRMVQRLTAFLNSIVCFLLALVILSPLLIYTVTAGYLPIPISLPLVLPSLSLPISVLISAIIALIIAFSFYQLALKNAEDFLEKAEI